jgi:hypothetical protein
VLYGFASDALGLAPTLVMIGMVTLVTLPLALALRRPLKQASEARA